ncbi:MAG: phenylacetic acid degradation protein [Flavobacteriales bacterium]|nr:phenylacetic acid degradation protein [Flavobacteriales bacterium]
MAKRFHPLTVSELIKETKDTISVKFSIPAELKDEYQYLPGQYLTIRTDINGESIRRSYSISSIPSEGELKISCKRVKGGRMSNYLYDNLAVGDSIEVMPADGSFTLKNPNKALILFAAGSGITPIISILKQYLKEGSSRVYLFYGNTTQEDIIFKDELESLRAQNADRMMVQHYLSGDGERLDKERVKSLVGNAPKGVADYYVCGPEGMMNTVLSALEEAGASKDEVHTEYFSNPEIEDTKQEKSAPAAPVSGDVNDIVVTLDDQDHEISLEDGESILEGAERIGIDPPFSCHSGVCTTCKAKLISGGVNMENNFGLGQDEIDDGYVLTCIGYPKEPGTKIDWDQV